MTPLLGPVVRAALDVQRVPVLSRFSTRHGLLLLAAGSTVVATSSAAILTGSFANPLLGLAPVLTLTAAYFVSNSLTTALAMVTRPGEASHHAWRTRFGWLSVSYFSAASLALLLSSNTREITLGGLGAAVPLLFVLYTTLKASVEQTADRTHELAQVNKLYVATVESLATALDARDHVTHGHVRRVQAHALALARRIGIRDDHQLKAIEVAALLHDTGKIAIPDSILKKPGKLTPAEYQQMKEHASIGADILSRVNFPYPVVPIVRHHHENYDGSGYPDGIAGTDIPIGARILSVIDCYDALISDRPYRRALPPDIALEIVRHQSGRMYDPAIVEAFVVMFPELSRLGAEPCEDTAESAESVLERVASVLPLPDGRGPVSRTAEPVFSSQSLEAIAGRAELIDRASAMPLA